MQAALNIDNSVSRIGLYGTHSEKLWCLSHTETLHLWEWVAACDEESAGQKAYKIMHPCRCGTHMQTCVDEAKTCIGHSDQQSQLASGLFVWYQCVITPPVRRWSRHAWRRQKYKGKYHTSS